MIADVIGREATLKLAKATKNRKLYVPKKMCAGHEVKRCGKTSKEPKPGCTCRGHWIANVVGDTLAVKLSKEFGGESLDLAPCYYVHAVERNKRIRDEHAAGKHPLTLSKEHGLTTRAISYILKGWNGRQNKPRGTEPPSKRR